MKISEGLIIQTAFDYDMPLCEVAKIVKHHPKQFYEKLEEFIKTRANETPIHPIGSNAETKTANPK